VKHCGHGQHSPQGARQFRFFKIASVTPFLRNDTSFLRRPTTAAILPDLQGPVKVRWNPPVPTTIDQHKPIMAAAN
jgi:hypothetical protein